MAPSNFEQYYAIKLVADKDFSEGVACQHEWSEEEFKKLFEDCWNTAIQSTKENDYQDEKDDLIKSLEEDIKYYEGKLEEIAIIANY
jgi:hypothetical protein